MSFLSDIIRKVRERRLTPITDTLRRVRERRFSKQSMFGDFQAPQIPTVDTSIPRFQTPVPSLRDTIKKVRERRLKGMFGDFKPIKFPTPEKIFETGAKPFEGLSETRLAQQVQRVSKEIEEKIGKPLSAFFERRVKAAPELPKGIFVKFPIKTKRAFEEILGKKPTEEIIKTKEGGFLQKIGIKEITPYSKQVIDLQAQGLTPFNAALRVGSLGILDAAIAGSWLDGATKFFLRGTNQIAVKKLAWDTLGKHETLEAAKKEYRRLAHIYHPDKMTGNEEMFKRINQAWEVLNKYGMPTLLEQKAILPARTFAKRLITPITEAVSPEAAEFVGLKGLLPREAGTIPEKPFQPKLKVKFGLGIEEVPARRISDLKETAKNITKEIAKQGGDVAQAKNIANQIAISTSAREAGKFLTQLKDLAKPEIPKEEATIETRIKEDFDRAESEVLTELELSKPGRRVLTETGEFIVEKSTFPDYVPSELRNSKLFAEVSKLTLDKEAPKTKRQKALVNVISQEIVNRMDIALADEKATNEFLISLDAKQEAETNKFLKDIKQEIIKKIKEKRFTVKQVVRIKEVAAKKLLAEKIKSVERLAISKADKQAKIQQLESEFKIRQEKAVRKEQLKTLKVGITERIKGIEKGLREGKIITKEEIKEFQTTALETIEKSNLDANDRDKFSRKVKNIQTQEQLQKALPDIKERIIQLEHAEIKRGLVSQIDKELKNIKPVKKGTIKVARYDYETNKFLQEIKDINKITQEDAEKTLANILKKDNLSRADIIKNRLLSYKMNGAKSSLALVDKILADIQELKDIGLTAKDELDFQKKLEKQDKITEVLEGIKNQKETIIGLKTLKKVFGSGIADLYSSLNLVAGKDIADKYNYARFITKSNNDYGIQSDNAVEKSKEIYKLESNRQLDKIFIERLAPQDFEIEGQDGFVEKISRFDIMNIYNGLKNDLRKEQFYNAFGEDQTNDLISKLSSEDKTLADFRMEQVQEYRDILNQRSIELTGMDMGQVENYWPSTSEHLIEFFDDIKKQSEIPGAIKARIQSKNIVPKMTNGWLLADRHIAQAEHIKSVSGKYEELKNLFSDRTVEKNIRQKYGDAIYNTLMHHIETFSLNQRTELLDIFQKGYNKVINNWVQAKIFTPTIMARQTISSVYSIGEVGAKNFFKYQKEALSNPKEAFNLIWNNAPFVKARFKRGYSEALHDVIRGTKKIDLGMKSLTKYITLPARSSDIAGLIINGYPIIKTNLAKGKTMEQAIAEFEKFSERTQGSPTLANLSVAQRSKNPFVRTFFRFKNTLNQLLRLQVDANIQLANKQISPQEWGTKTFLYSIYTPMMYVLLGYAVRQGWKKIFGTDDEEESKSLLGDILENIIIQPFKAVPLLGDVFENLYQETRKKITGKKTYGNLISLPIIDDLDRAKNIIFKKELTTEDFLKVLSIVQELFTGFPTESGLRYYGYATKKQKVKLPTKGKGRIDFSKYGRKKDKKRIRIDFSKYKR